MVMVVEMAGATVITVAGNIRVGVATVLDEDIN